QGKGGVYKSGSCFHAGHPLLKGSQQGQGHPPVRKIPLRGPEQGDGPIDPFLVRMEAVETQIVVDNAAYDHGGTDSNGEPNDVDHGKELVLEDIPPSNLKGDFEYAHGDRYI